MTNAHQKYRTKTPIPVFLQIKSTPIYTTGKNSFITQTFQLCGAINVFDDHRNFFKVSQNEILDAKPVAIIDISSNTKSPSYQKRDYYNGIKVYTLNPDNFLRFVPRLGDGIISACQLIDKIRHNISCFLHELNT